MAVKVLFVCLGNICRSPTAEGVFKKLVDDSGLSDFIYSDSAGTANWHHGKAPDSRTIAAAKRRDIDISMLRARAVQEQDFHQFDYVLAMDKANYEHLDALKPTNYAGHLGLFLAFGKQTGNHEVPDPYYGSSDGFELVLDLVEDAAAGLLANIQQNKMR